MNFFWSSFFGHLQGCGRSATWFLVTLGGLFVFLIVSAWAIETGHGDSIAAALITAAVCFTILLGVAIRRAIVWSRDCLKLTKLSDDELSKARAKLAKRVKTAAPLAPSPARLRTRPPVGEVY